MDFVIRKATKKDIPLIESLFKESVEYHKSFDEEFYHNIPKEDYKSVKRGHVKALKEKGNSLLVVSINNEVKGYIWGYIKEVDKEKMGVLQEIIITKKYRKLGLGNKLLKKTINFFSEHNCKSIRVSVYANNMPAIKNYEKSGFKKKKVSFQLDLRD